MGETIINRKRRRAPNESEVTSCALFYCPPQSVMDEGGQEAMRRAHNWCQAGMPGHVTKRSCWRGKDRRRHTPEWTLTPKKPNSLFALKNTQKETVNRWEDRFGMGERGTIEANRRWMCMCTSLVGRMGGAFENTTYGSSYLTNTLTDG